MLIRLGTGGPLCGASAGAALGEAVAALSNGNATKTLPKISITPMIRRASPNRRCVIIPTPLSLAPCRNR